MFVQLWQDSGGGDDVANDIFEMHPNQLVEVIEMMWAQRQDWGNAFSPLPAHPDHPYNAVLPHFLFHHLSYAYMMENTRVYEVFDKLLYQLLHTERMGLANVQAQSWVRNTVDLFYDSAPHGTIRRVTNRIRPDQRAIRRNAYFRMFGLDLNHGCVDAKAYPFDRSDGGGKEFIPLFEELLREVWKAIVYFSSTAGPNETDDGKMVDLVRRLRELLSNRRQFGTLRREEFDAVAAMSWFDLTLRVNAPILQSLGISMTTSAERLLAVGRRVGYPAHPKCDSFLQLAGPVSEILIGLEDGDFTGPGGVAQFYATGTSARANMETIITHWSIATGRNLKAREVNPQGMSLVAR